MEDAKKRLKITQNKDFIKFSDKPFLKQQIEDKSIVDFTPPKVTGIENIVTVIPLDVLPATSITAMIEFTVETIVRYSDNKSTTTITAYTQKVEFEPNLDVSSRVTREGIFTQNDIDIAWEITLECAADESVDIYYGILTPSITNINYSQTKTTDEIKVCNPFETITSNMIIQGLKKGYINTYKNAELLDKTPIKLAPKGTNEISDVCLIVLLKDGIEGKIEQYTSLFDAYYEIEGDSISSHGDISLNIDNNSYNLYGLYLTLGRNDWEIPVSYVKS